MIIDLIWRNFSKEQVILFHRSAAAPWGHVASIIKRSSTGNSLSFLVPLPQLLASGPFRSSLLTVYVFGTFHHRDPRATNARAGLKGTGHTQLSSSRHFICKPPTLHTLSANSLHKTFTNLQTPYQTYFIFNLTTFTTNVTIFYIFNSSLNLLLWTVTYTFVVYSIWCKTMFIVVVVVVYKFCCMYKSFVFLSSKAVTMPKILLVSPALMNGLMDSQSM